MSPNEPFSLRYNLENSFAGCGSLVVPTQRYRQRKPGFQVRDRDGSITKPPNGRHSHRHD
jgi:hypothetical protein